MELEVVECSSIINHQLPIHPPPPFAISQPLQSPPPLRETVKSQGV